MRFSHARVRVVLNYRYSENVIVSLSHQLEGLHTCTASGMCGLLSLSG